MLKVENKQKNIDPHEGRIGLIYTRVSSKKQETEGTGLQSQEARCLVELDRLKVPHAKTFFDSYTGGGDFMLRPEMRALLKYIDDHPHKKFLLVFDDLKRFARDVIFHLKLKQEFKKRDVTLNCLNHNFDDTAEGEFIETILAASNQLDRKSNRRQVIQKMKARLDVGYWAFGVKRGYKSTKDALHGKLSVPIPREAKLLKEALEGFSIGIFVSKMDACKFLVKNGFWKLEPRKYVYLFDQMLRDPFYAGYIEYPKWEVSRRKGRHKPIISDETFELNQKRLSGVNVIKNTRKDVSNDFALRGLLNCAECTKHLTASWTKGNGGMYGFYFCQNKQCQMFRKSINKNVIEDKFKELLTTSTLKPEVDSLLSVIFNKVWKKELKSFKEGQDAKLIEQKILSEKIDQLTELVIQAKSKILKNNYENQLEQKVLELNETTKELGANYDLSIPYQTALKKAGMMLKSPYRIWESVSTEEKHKLFFFIFEEKLLFSKKDGYQTNKIPSAIRLFEDFIGADTNDVDPCPRYSNTSLS